MSPPSIWKLPPKHSHFAETRSISLMQAAGTRIPLIERKGYLRSPIRNEVEHSAKIFLAECSTRWPSAQYFRSIIQPNYHVDFLAICTSIYSTSRERKKLLRSCS